MTILCGVDFSPSSKRAADVAMALASRSGAPLHLVHAMELPRHLEPEARARLFEATQKALESFAAALQDGEGMTAPVRTTVELGSPEEVLVAAARAQQATLLIFGVVGEGEARGHRVGTNAERLAQQTRVPTLAVRDEAPLLRWLSGQSPLQALVGLDDSHTSLDAWAWARALGRVAPVSLTGAHVYWPPQEFHRLGLLGVRSYVDADPEVERVLRREFEQRLGLAPAQLRLQPGIGRPADHLVALAAQQHSELLVVGSHVRSAVGRLWEGSVSRGALHDAPCSVACVPPLTTQSHAAKEIRSVLAATDFSALGDAAVLEAFAPLARGGKVTALHVLPVHHPHSQLEPRDLFSLSHEAEADAHDARERLRRLAPVPELLHGKGFEALVVEASNTADAIAQAAERVGAELICLGSHGGGGLRKALLGSVAEAVVARTRRPVMLVKTERA